MIKLMKKFLTVAVAAVLLVLTGICAAAAKKYPEPTDRFFINDYAGVIDSSAEDEIYSRAASAVSLITTLPTALFPVSL